VAVFKLGDWNLEWGLIIPHLTTDMLQNFTEPLRVGFKFETVEAKEN
jgi:hypothetical protein